ncbi:MAG: flagellar hook-associated protein 3 [Treponema sp.]|jgi:flagellar hook-associated protein 3 FlgL|nr:flagellar hook-associated protein 3 [Treponema sp.]
MFRISTNMPNDDMQFRLRRQEEQLANIQAKIAGQTKFNNLRDDPLAASHAVRYDSYLARLNRFEKNALYAEDRFNQTDAYLRQANDILQRIREIAVQGANGIYMREDMRAMGIEVNELMKELTSIANAVGPDGTRIFSGDKALSEPFRLIEGRVEGGEETLVTAVEYRGAGATRKTETGDRIYINLDISGGEAFWAEKMQIFSSVDATNYQVPQRSSFFIDGVEITVNPGENLAGIVDKINDSSAPVKAYIEPDTRALVLEGTNAHIIRLEDREGTTVLQDLGMIDSNAETDAPNWNPSAKVFGGSVFDMVMQVRDALYQGDSTIAGGAGIGGMDLALANVQARLTDIGSRAERAESTWRRINAEIPAVTSAYGREASLDFATASLDLSMFDFAHKATLQTAAKILPRTLLDFLR